MSWSAGVAGMRRRGKFIRRHERRRAIEPQDHRHGHGHSQDHARGSALSEVQLRVRARETILTEKGYIDPAALDRIVEALVRELYNSPPDVVELARQAIKAQP